MVQVNVCEVVPTSFVAVAGEREMFASTTVQALDEAAALWFVEMVVSTARTMNVWEPVPRPVKIWPVWHGVNPNPPWPLMLHSNVNPSVAGTSLNVNETVRDSVVVGADEVIVGTGGGVP
jgi:hypothetical protein